MTPLKVSINRIERSFDRYGTSQRNLIPCQPPFPFPPAGAVLADPKIPRNINYFFGMDDMSPQQWVAPGTYVLLWITALTALIFVPTHLVLKKACKLSPVH